MNHDQKIGLTVNNDNKGEVAGPKLNSHELEELGLDEDTIHVKLEFDHTSTIKYLCCQTLAALNIFAVLGLFCLPCCWFAMKSSAESRKAAVTNSQIVVKSGAYGCFCCCWGETTKSVALQKITDVSVSQDCCARMFDVKVLSVQTASSSDAAPEFQLVGLIEPDETRKLVLKTRDNDGFQGMNFGGASKQMTVQRGGNNNLNNPLLSNVSDTMLSQTFAVNQQQAQTLHEIKDVLVDVRDVLKALNTTMSQSAAGGA
eukprot:CAMPEP_0202686892 /NCGR_PEP_ID=MMETSP1385-20130828/2654_1 /ASSEMBLY_ACC=CAM_ASM_000861 /TAXON_ID=933848 /ORGANISM="Elphidium margaritaceum" /LENGTH=257 /DNA_ID=CAMNT_0049341567 /DNA_START=29 /DNA_END=799 /DNA_ORIENTATION=+